MCVRVRVYLRVCVKSVTLFHKWLSATHCTLNLLAIKLKFMIALERRTMSNAPCGLSAQLYSQGASHINIRHVLRW